MYHQKPKPHDQCNQHKVQPFRHEYHLFPIHRGLYDYMRLLKVATSADVVLENHAAFVVVVVVAAVVDIDVDDY